MMKELEFNCWNVIPDVISGIFPRLMPPIGEPIPAKKCEQKLETRTFYIVPVCDPEEKQKKFIVVRANECTEAEVAIVWRAKNGEVRTMQKRLPAQSAGVWRDVRSVAGAFAGA